MRSKQVANCDSERLTEVIVAFCDAGSTKIISRTKASSEPPNNWKGGLRILPMTTVYVLETYLHDPYRCLLLAPQNPFSSYNPSIWVDTTVKNIYADDMGALWIRVFSPHPNDNVRPGVPRYMARDRLVHLNEHKSDIGPTGNCKFGRRSAWPSNEGFCGGEKGGG